MSWPRIVAVVAPCLAIALGIVMPNAPAAELKSGTTGYRRVVDTILVPERILVATDELDRSRRAYGSKPRGMVVDLDPARLESFVDANPEFASLRKFVASSFLRADLARNDPDLWSQDNVLLGFAREPHIVTSPFDRLNWTGSLLYHGDVPPATFVSLGEQADWQELTGREGQRLGTSADDGYVVAAFPNRRIEVTSDPGGKLILQSEPRFGQFRLDAEVSARFCGSGDSAADPGDSRRLTLVPGVCVELRSEGAGGIRPLRMIQLTQSKVISEDPGLQLSGPASLPYARLSHSVRTSLSDWVADCSNDCAGADKDLTSSLDPQLSRFAQGVVTDAARRFGITRSVAVTVLDGRSGNVLAMASIDGDPLYGRDPRHGQEDLNFIDLTIGSAAKPLIAQAIFAQEETAGDGPSAADLTDLEISDTEPRISGDRVTRVLGVPLGGALEARRVPSRGGWVNASEFIAHSSNYYAAGLALLASCERGEARGPRNESMFKLAPAEFRPCPDRAVETSICPPWRNSFNALYVNDPASTEVGKGRCPDHAETWQPSYLPLWSHAGLSSTMAASLPRPYALGWNFRDLKSYRSQIINMMIGGQAYPWNNILLTQSYARLLTGNAVEASLLHTDRVNGKILPLGRTGPVCDGLERVATIGTARGHGLTELVGSWQDKAPNSALVLLSKTGTPDVDAPSEPETGRIGEINRCIRSSRLWLEGPAGRQSAGWRLAGQSCAGMVPQAVSDPLTGDGAESIEIAGVAFNVDNGRLIKAIARVNGEYQPKIYVFAIAQRRAETEGERRSGCHQVSDRGPILIVAINVNDPKAKQNLAHLAIAKDLLERDGALRDWFVARLR